MAPGNGPLAILDVFFEEFHDPMALEADQMVVVAAAIEFENRLPVGKAVAANQSGILELGQDAIHRGQTDVLVPDRQSPVHVLGAEMTLTAGFQNVQNLDPGQGDFQSRLPDPAVFQTVFSLVRPVRYHSRSHMSLDDGSTMQKVLIFSALGASLILSGCSGQETRPEYRESVLANLPFVYKMTVQQGNLVTEEMIDRLEPGMTRVQVRYLLGTPALIDIFHTDRWYYTYTIQRGHDEMEKRPLVVYFDGDLLVKTEGDLHPNPQRAAAREPQEILVSVPDWDGRIGLLDRTLRGLGMDRE